jgi:hypothetical protein
MRRVDVMNEKISNVIKWGLLLLIAGIIFYVFYPKYHFGHTNDLVIIRANKITGKVEVGTTVLKWQEIGKGSKKAKE